MDRCGANERCSEGWDRCDSQRRPGESWGSSCSPSCRSLLFLPTSKTRSGEMADSGRTGEPIKWYLESAKVSRAWQCSPVIPATRKVAAGGLQVPVQP